MPLLDHRSSIYVAGHAGLLGSAMVRRLTQEGLTKIITRTRQELDLRDGRHVAAFLQEAQPDYVVLAAGRVGGIVENQSFPADFLDENLAIQMHVLQASRDAGVKKLIFFGSSCMYPRECAQPMPESALLEGKPEPTSLPYAISKLVGTHLCLSYNRQYGEQKFIPVIPNSAYGPNDNFDPASGHVLSALMARFHEAKVQGRDDVMLWGSGAPRREFVHADDIADACLHILKHDCTALELPVNIGSGHDVSIKDLAEMMAGVVGYNGRLRWDRSKPDGAPRNLLDSARLTSFGWKAKIPLSDGLTRTYEWYVRTMATAYPVHAPSSV